MTNWFIIQNLESYSQHHDWIGCGFSEGTNDPYHSLFKEIKKGDKVVYYATGDKVIVGIFEVLSEQMEIIEKDEYWDTTIGIYRLKLDVMPKKGEYLDFKRLLSSPDVSFKLFPEKDRWQYKIWNHYIYRMADEDLAIVRSAILNSQYMVPHVEEKGDVLIIDRLGIPVETISLLFEPVDEMGVVYLFARYHRRLGFPFIVKLRNKFPDVTAIDSRGETKLIELEYRASNFLQHRHPKEGCDYLVCWENDWINTPDEEGSTIIPLKEALTDLFRSRA